MVSRHWSERRDTGEAADWALPVWALMWALVWALAAVWAMVA